MPFDPKQNHVQIIGPGRARYFQDGYEYDAEFRVVGQFETGDLNAPVGEVPPEHKRRGRPPKGDK